MGQIAKVDGGGLMTRCNGERKGYKSPNLRKVETSSRKLKMKKVTGNKEDKRNRKRS